MKMENLRDLKDVMIVVYAKMIQEVPLRSNLPYELVDFTKKSILKFKEAYIEFEKRIGDDTDMYAHWMTVQLHVMTLLDGDDKLLVHHAETVYGTLMGTSGGSNADVFFDKDKKRVDQPNYPRSVLIALAFRVFLDNIEVVVEAAGKTPQPPPVVAPVKGATA